MPVIIISAYADVPTTVRLMRNGAITVLQKPHQPDELAEAIRLALETDEQRRRAHAERRQLQQRIKSLDPRERRTMELLVVGQPSNLIAEDRPSR